MAYLDVDEMISNLKTLQAKPDTVDSAVYELLIKMAVDKVINDVSAFTNTPAKELPAELSSAMLLKVSSWVTDAGVFLSPAERQESTVKGVTEGDTSITYGNPQAALSALGGVSFVDEDFRTQLIRYRRLRW